MGRNRKLYAKTAVTGVGELMSVKKKAVIGILAVLYILLSVFILTHRGASSGSVSLHMELSGTVPGDIQVYYGKSVDFLPSSQSLQTYKTAGEETELTYTVPSDSSFLRIDFGTLAGNFTISRLYFTYGSETEDVDLSAFTSAKAAKVSDIGSAELTDGKLTVQVLAGDPYIAAQTGPKAMAAQITAELAQKNLIKNIVYFVIVSLICGALFVFRKNFSTLPVELLQNRGLILKLAKNDFKTKFAGSVLGITWAFIQPAVTVLVYWFVFQIGLGSGNVTAATGVTYPFVLWLICGLVPWFFFQDTISGGTNSLMEYTYLVKKVVFKISVLPIVKEISALFVHLFFIALTIILFAINRHFPDLYTLQVLYYSFCLFIYSLGVCYATCSIVVFFKDLTQIISIILQIQVWMTPIMWNIDSMQAKMPGWLITIFKLNPLYYIVNGYRDALMNKVWFWTRFDLTFYFWIVTAVFFGLGVFIFKRLKVHFADIL